MEKKLKKNLLFIMASWIGILADVGTLNLLSLVIEENIANTVSYIIGVAVAFFLCRNFVFKTKDNTTRRIITSTITHIIGLLIQAFLFNVLRNKGLDLNIAKAITIAENGILMYCLDMFVVFRRYNETKKIGGYYLNREPKILFLYTKEIETTLRNLSSSV